MNIPALYKLCYEEYLAKHVIDSQRKKTEAYVHIKSEQFTEISGIDSTLPVLRQIYIYNHGKKNKQENRMRKQ